jgi:hypothetical protein
MAALSRTLEAERTIYFMPYLKLFKILIEVVSKPQIRFKGKAYRGLKAERTR